MTIYDDDCNKNDCDKNKNDNDNIVSRYYIANIKGDNYKNNTTNYTYNNHKSIELILVIVRRIIMTIIIC
jgi:hypothetical protein